MAVIDRRRARSGASVLLLDVPAIPSRPPKRMSTATPMPTRPGRRESRLPLSAGRSLHRSIDPRNRRRKRAGTEPSKPGDVAGPRRAIVPWFDKDGCITVRPIEAQHPPHARAKDMLHQATGRNRKSFHAEVYPLPPSTAKANPTGAFPTLPGDTAADPSKADELPARSSPGRRGRWSSPGGRRPRQGRRQADELPARSSPGRGRWSSPGRQSARPEADKPPRPADPGALAAAVDGRHQGRRGSARPASWRASRRSMLITTPAVDDQGHSRFLTACYAKS